MTLQISCVFLSFAVALVCGYPTTVPNSAEVCSQMTPGHGPSPQNSQSPYTLGVSTTQVKGGNNVQVTLKGSENTFKGFYIQARDARGSPIGSFIPDDGVYKVHGCGGIKGNAAHHAKSDDKNLVVVHWKAPKAYSGQVTFVATFVEEFETFWTNVKSPVVKVSVFDTHQRELYLIDSGKEGTFSEATQEGRILNYNPYSPFSPLMDDGAFNSKEFVRSLTDRNEGQKQMGAPIPNHAEPHQPSASRIRKSYYIPAQHPPSDGVIINNVENCRFHGHKRPVIGSSPGIVIPTPVSNYASDYRYPYSSSSHPSSLGFQSYTPLLTNPSPTAIAGGFQKLGTSGFQSDSFRTHSPIPSLPPGRVTFHDNRFVRPLGDVAAYGTPSLSPTLYHNVHKHVYGAVSNEDGTIIDTAIVLPKNMEIHDIPRYGYVIYNPKKGPPFYLIPADTESFERVYFRDLTQRAVT